jgi:signal transduction histidine kinase
MFIYNQLPDTLKNPHTRYIYTGKTFINSVFEMHQIYTQSLIRNKIMYGIFTNAQREKLEDFLAQKKSMQSVLGLAAGVAHEINNPLGIMLQGAQNILRRIDETHPTNMRTAQALDLDLTKMKRYFEERNIFHFMNSIRDSGERAAKIISNLVSFSNKNHQSKTQAVLTDIIDHTLKILEPSLTGIRIIKHYADPMPPISCSTLEIQEVCFNILKNAIQALENISREPLITLTISNDTQYLKIIFQDNGIGMTENIKTRAFEPFFTTRPTGTGMGLGLSVSYDIIVTHHQGICDIESTPDVGTTLTLTLPKECA